MKVLLTVGVITVCYLIGSIPMGLLLTRIATGHDIRQVGSGRTGATNVLRGAGPWLALLTILGDGLKGFAAVLMARIILKTNTAEAIAGLMAVIGHNYSIFINFRGGAGTVATVGGAISIWPWSAVILILVGTSVIAATRYASLGSIAIAIVVPILMALLWQTGYLTFAKKIQSFDETYEYQLKVPNREIQKSLNQLFLNYLTDQPVKVLVNQKLIYHDFTNAIEHLEITLTSLFASIPYNNYANKIIARYEGYYASVVYTYFASLGYSCIAEDVTQKGRIDLTIKFPERIVIIEFKVDQKEAALKQIKDKKYYDKYRAEAQAKQQDIYIVGICFSSEDKNITEFAWEKI